VVSDDGEDLFDPVGEGVGHGGGPAAAVDVRQWDQAAFLRAVQLPLLDPEPAGELDRAESLPVPGGRRRGREDFVDSVGEGLGHGDRPAAAVDVRRGDQAVVLRAA
jgi:hypothetical protein